MALTPADLAAIEATFRRVVREELATSTPSASTLDAFVSTKEAAHMLGCDERTVRRRIKARLLTATRTGARGVLVLRTSVHALMPKLSGECPQSDAVEW